MGKGRHTNCGAGGGQVKTRRRRGKGWWTPEDPAAEKGGRGKGPSGRCRNIKKWTKKWGDTKRELKKGSEGQ